MNLYPRTYHYIGEITLEDGTVLQLERLPDEEIDPWLFLVFDEKGEKRYTFFYKIEQPTKVSCEKSFSIQMSFLVEGRINTKEVIKLGQTYDVWRDEDLIGKVMIVKIL